MKKNKRVILLSSCLLVLTLGAFAFMSAYGESSAAGKPIKIGVILSMTGPLAPAGPNCKQGVELRLHEAGGQVAGRPIELIYEDDKTDQVTSLEKARKLVESDKVDLILGPIALEFIINYTAKAKVPQIGFRPIIPRPDTMKLPYTFIPPGSFKTFIYPMAWYAYDKMGFRTATCMATDRDDGIEQVAAFKEAFEERGGKVIHSQLAPIGTADYAPYLIKLKKADVMMIFLDIELD